MADELGFLTFTDVSMDSIPTGSTAAFSPATLQIDYTTGTVTVDPSSPPFTFGGVAFDFAPGTYTLVAVPLGPHTPTTIYILGSVLPGVGGFEVNWTGQSPAAFNLSPPPAGFVASTSTAFGGTFASNQVAPDVCFAAGTLIRRPGGDAPVETLTVGDLVLTASGEMRPIKWMGRRDVDFRGTVGASPGQPIRIAAEAFGPSRPSQDLYLSAGHSVCVDLLGEVFIPIGCLINGATIVRVEVEEISYWHVELDSHDVLIANNLPAESYLATNNRAAFEEMRGLLPANRDEFKRTHADFCRPVVTGGPVLEFVSERLAARAEEIGREQSRGAPKSGPVARPKLRMVG
jgi:hypothetical protein